MSQASGITLAQARAARRWLPLQPEHLNPNCNPLPWDPSDVALVCQASATPLALFEHGQRAAARRGLLLQPGQQKCQPCNLGPLPHLLVCQASAAALALFEHGQRAAARRGLLLVDTKYEFGTDAGGRILLVDEIHTPDSSRRAGREPDRDLPA